MPDDDLGEGVAGQGEGLVLGFCFLIIRQGVGGLDIDLLAADGGHEVDLPCHLDSAPFLIFIVAVHDANIYGTSTDDQIVVDDILHDMGHFLLAETDPGISQPQVLAVVFVGVIKIILPLHIPSFALAKQECVRQVIHIALDGVRCDGMFATALLFGVERIGYIGRIGQGANGGAQQVQYGVQYIGTFDLLPLDNILQVGFGEKGFQICHFCCIGGSGKHQGHTAKEGVVIKGLLLIAANGRIILCKTQRMDMNLVTAASEFGEDVRGKATLQSYH